MRKFLKTQIQQALRQHGPLTAAQIQAAFKISKGRTSELLHQMMDAGYVEKAGKAPKGEAGSPPILWASTERTVQESKRKPPRPAVKIGEVTHRIIDAAKAPKLAIEPHELTRALFGQLEAA